MSYRSIRIDFNDGEKCEFCPNKLTSYTGVLLEQIETGKKVWAGPTCAKKNSLHYNDPIPNIVKASYITEPKDGESHSDGRYIYKENTSGPTMEDALSYLILCEEKLKHIPWIKNQGLEDLYQRLQSNILTEENILTIKKIIIKNKQDHKELSLTWVRNIYACDASIDRCLKKKPNSDFFKGLKNYLYKNRLLKPKQIISMNEDLNKLGFKHKISPNAFEIG